MAKDLTLTCTELPADTLTFMPQLLQGGGAKIFVEPSANNPPCWYFDERQARELFNWLGVWLHGGNRS